MNRAGFSLLIAALLSGCASMPDSGRFPSLLPRAIESRSDAMVLPPVAVATPDPALDARLAELERRLVEATATFDTGFARADRVANAARGVRAGGDAWLDAQIALAELDVLRTDTRLVIADLEQLAADRALELAPDYPGLAALIEQAKTQETRQNERIASIEARLAPA
ncbi:hypothetical protein [Sphingomonas sp. AX6]|uniref:hypothetical protein n=1 Tax=Sphingomonas sp. AX6 TaxID=2653171 RepID=UPI0012F3B66F|nr:hypothetical protein [Sphingomonas sp. AX6]VXC77311.1 hypothetical protein SPHINGOAX6_40430 [Sphingomonas sp. AX6]